jgi:prepilin-type N-terminal cleavage/methylation domain-containing protein
MGQDGMRQRRGFSLIELMVSIAVLVVIVALSVPSLQAVRQRATTRAAGDQLLSFWNQARLEAAKRNTWVKVGLIQSNSGGTYCLGAATTTAKDDTAPCNCTNATSCDIARLGINQSEWRGVTLQRSTIGAADWPTATSPLAAVIEPKQGALGMANQAGYIAFTAPAGRRTYHLRVNIDQFGRAAVCQPNSDADKMSDFGGRKC